MGDFTNLILKATQDDNSSVPSSEPSGAKNTNYINGL
jgi:hypothetical protein